MIEYVFIGVDIAKNKFDVAQATCKKKKQFTNNHEGFQKFLAYLMALKKTSWVTMEATGIYGEALANFLFENNIKVSVVNPTQIKYFAKSLLQRNKNDFVDAQVIAQFAEIKKPHTYVPKSKENKALRELLQILDMYVRQLTQWKNKLHAATSSIARKAIGAEIKALEKKMAKLKETIKNIAKKDERTNEQLELVQSIKGVGIETALRLVAYLPDVQAFSSAKQLAAYIGVSPKQKQSGNFTGQTRLAKTGEAHIRRALYMPALSAMRFNEHLLPFVERLRKSGHCPMQIIGALMRKLTHLIFGILKSGKPFDPKLV